MANELQPIHSQEAEEAYIGCLLLDYDATTEKAPANPDWFYDLRLRTIYEEILTLGRKVDIILFCQTLRDNKQLEAVGGVVYISSLMDVVPSAANALYYRDIIKEKAALRKLDQWHQLAPKGIREFQGEFDQFVAKTRSEFESILEESEATSVEVMDGLKGAHEFVNEAQHYEALNGAYSGIPTGWKNLDDLTWGLQFGQMNLFGARPSTGKTSILGNVVEHNAIDLHTPCLVFSYEMTARRLIFRLACARAGVNSKLVKQAALTEGDMQKLMLAVDAIKRAPIYIVDCTRITVPEMRPIVRRYMRDKGVKLVAIDYLQKIPAVNQRQDKHHQIAEVSGDLQKLFKDTGAASLILAQLNRDAAGQRPKESDIGQSGQIETDADTIILPWRDPNFTFDQAQWAYQFLVPKSRDGEQGVAHMWFTPTLTKFSRSLDRHSFK